MYKLVIVDDELEILNGLSQFFPWESIGFHVVAHMDSANRAFEYIKKNPADIVLCDINMPVMSGLDLAKLLYEQFPQIIIVFLSGYSDFSYAQQALEYNVKSYVLKSSKYNDLIHIFTKLKIRMDQERVDYDAVSFMENSMNFNDKVIVAIKDYIKEHYVDVTLEDLTQIVHMNPNYISRFFKQKTNQNFSEYLIEVRMKKAAELLDDIQYKTYEVSALVGYSNSVNFTRTFKNFFGMSPREYRNRTQKKRRNANET